MSFALVSEDLTVGGLLSGRFAFVLPEFQRDYAWGPAEAEHLLEDIEGARQDAERNGEATPYFLGTMLFAEPTEDEPLRQTQVIDGQQRITTLTILLAVLRDCETDPDLKALLHRHVAVWSTRVEDLDDAFHLTPRRLDRNYFARAIQKDGATNRRRRQPLQPRSDAQSRIEAVRKCFRDALRGPAAEDMRRKLVPFLLDHCRVLCMRTKSLDYAYQIFLTINGRGLPLTDDDIVVAEVIGPLSAEQRSRFEPVLAQMSRYRDETERNRTRGKTFFTHLVALNGWSKDRMITELRRAVVRHGGAAAFTRDVFQPMAEAYLLTRGLPGAREVSPDVRERLDRLALLEQLCDDEWVGTAMVGLSKIPDGSPDLAFLLDQLDRFAHALLILRSNRLERRKRYRKAIDALSGAISRSAIEAAFRLTDAEQTRILKRCATQLVDTSTRTDKAVLMRLDAAASGRPARWYIDLLERLNGGEDKISVEHVLPKGRNLAKQSTWQHHFPNTDDRIATADHLGNLILMSERGNRALAQRDWTDKRRVLAADSIASSFAVTAGACQIETWDRAALAARHRTMMAILQDIWGFKGDAPQVPEAPTRGRRRRRKPFASKT